MPCITIIVLISLMFFPSCQRTIPGPGIEGQINIFGLNIPASGVTVTAITKTDIKEEQSKAVLRTKSDSSGNFIIRGLLPNKLYRLQIADQSFIGSEENVETPHEGTRIIEKPLIALPIPPTKGVWVYTSNMKPTEIMAKAKMVAIDQVFIYKGYYNHSHYAFYIDKQRADNNISVKIPRNSIIVSREIPLNDIDMLFRIATKTLYVSGTTTFPKVPTEIIDGYYYNISDFYTKASVYDKDHNELHIKYHNPTNTLSVIGNKNKTIIAIPVDKSISNYLMLTTKTYYAPEKKNLINTKFYLGIQDYKCPAEGIIIQIGDFKKVEVEDFSTAKKIPEMPHQQAVQSSAPKQQAEPLPQSAVEPKTATGSFSLDDETPPSAPAQSSFVPSVRRAAPPPQAAWGGRWPWTSGRLLQPDDLMPLSLMELELMRNEIYARHGWVFNRRDLQDYFARQPWYSPKGNISNREQANRSAQEELNALEKKNIQTIISREKALKR